MLLMFRYIYYSNNVIIIYTNLKLANYRLSIPSMTTETACTASVQPSEMQPRAEYATSSRSNLSTRLSLITFSRFFYPLAAIYSSPDKMKQCIISTC